jgi:hypothetical protein
MASFPLLASQTIFSFSCSHEAVQWRPAQKVTDPEHWLYIKIYKPCSFLPLLSASQKQNFLFFPSHEAVQRTKRRKEQDP